MPKAKIKIDENVKGQFLAAGRIVRELAKYTPVQRARIMEVVNEARYELPEPDPRQIALDAGHANDHPGL